MRLSVIIPSYNSEDMIRPCLNSLLQQKTAVPFEIIVIESGNDGTADIVRSEFPKVILINLPVPTFPGAARNRGLDVAQGEILAFIDTKLSVHERWIDLVSKYFEDPSLQAIAGARKCDPKATLAGKFQFYIEFFDFQIGRSSAFKKFVPAGNSAFKASQISKLRFREDLRTIEDTVFCQDWRNAGNGLIAFHPDLYSTYTPVKSWKHAFQHIYSLGRWSGKTRCRTPMAGSFFKRFPFLSVFLFPYRLGRFYLVGMRNFSLGEWLTLSLFFPLIALGFLQWTIAFLVGLIEDREWHPAIKNPSIPQRV